MRGASTILCLLAVLPAAPSEAQTAASSTTAATLADTSTTSEEEAEADESFPLEPGRYTLCVNALRGAISVIEREPYPFLCGLKSALDA